MWWHQQHSLQRQDLYDPRLAKLPQIIVANKIDLPQAKAGFQKLQQHLEDKEKVIPISAVTGEGLTKLLYSTYQILEDAIQAEDNQETESQTAVFRHKDDSRSFTVTKDGPVYVLTGKAVRRNIVMTDMANDQAVMMLHRRLKRMGVIKALTEAGAKDGDTVVVDNVEFTFMSEHF